MLIPTAAAADIRWQEAQNLLLGRLFDHPATVPPVINLRTVRRVLCVGGGACAWGRALATAQSGLDVFLVDGPVSNGTQLLGSDPATTSIPSALLGTFDLVRVAGVGGMLRQDGWRTLLANLYAALKPGGYIVVVEGDPVAYTEKRPPPLAGAGHDLTAAMSGSSALTQVNCVLTGAALQRQLVVDLSYRLGHLLQAAGLRVAACSRALGPTGTLCSRYTGLHGTPLHDVRATATTIVCETIEALSRTLLSRGRLEAPLSTPIGTEEGRASVARGAKVQIQEGVLFLFAEWVAQRPMS